MRAASVLSIVLFGVVACSPAPTAAPAPDPPPQAKPRSEQTQAAPDQSLAGVVFLQPPGGVRLPGMQRAVSANLHLRFVTPPGYPPSPVESMQVPLGWDGEAWVGASAGAGVVAVRWNGHQWTLGVAGDLAEAKFGLPHPTAGPGVRVYNRHGAGSATSATGAGGESPPFPVIFHGVGRYCLGATGLAGFTAGVLTENP